MTKKKLLLILIPVISIIFSNNVYAAPTNEDTLTCSATANLWDGELALGLAAGNKGSSLTFDETSTSYSFSTKYIAIEPNTTYTLSYWNQSPASPGSKAFLFYLTSDLVYTASGSISIGVYGYHNYEFTTPADISYLLIRFGSSASMSSVIKGLGTNIIFQLSKGSVNLTSTDDYVAYKPCTVEEPDEDEPYIPPEGMNAITNFYTIYFEKLKTFLFNVSGNYLFLTFLVIILLYISVDLFFKIFRR